MIFDPVKYKIGLAIRKLAKEDPAKLKTVMSNMSEKEKEKLTWDWQYWAREKQTIRDYSEGWPENVIVFCGGRGTGKSKMASEWIRHKVKQSQQYILLIGPTSAKVRDIMVLGDSGILNVHPEDERPVYAPSYAKVEWKNGSIGQMISAEEPDRIRGANSTLVWIDELGEIFDKDVFDQAMLTLRRGESRILITTTPRLGNPTLLELYDKAVFNFDPPEEGKYVRFITDSTYSNLDNLSATFKQQVLSTYENTRLGRQEIHGEMLFEQEGALWTNELIHRQTVAKDYKLPRFEKIAIGVDPAVTATKKSDKTGIVVAGFGEDGYAYVLKDLTGMYGPSRWPQIVREEYDFWKQKCTTIVICEKNQGGDLVREALLREDPLMYIKDIFNTKNKIVRAEPVAAQYERGKVWHIRESFDELNRELTTYAGLPKQKSPDRMDAMVFSLTELLLNARSYVLINEILM